jgi:hypothetical protein
MEEIAHPTSTPDAVGGHSMDLLREPCPAGPEAFVSSQIDLSLASAIREDIERYDPR